AAGIRTTEELAETTGLELHLAAALVAFQARAFVALDTVLPLFDLVARTVRVVATDVQFAGFIQQIGIHRGGTDRTAVLAEQHAGFGLTLVVRSDLVARYQVDGGLAALLRRQRIAGATEEHAGGGGTNHHRPAALAARNVSQGRLVGTHAALACFGSFELLLEVAIELVEQVLPLALTLGHIVEMLLHGGGEAVIHQVGEALVETLGDDVAHLLGIEAAVVHRHVAAILNGGDDRSVGRRTADAAFFQLLDQAGFGIARRRLGEVLAGVELNQLEALAFLHFRQHVVLTRLALLRQNTGITVELEDTALGTQFEITSGHGDAGGQVLGWRHLTGDELAPDQVIQAFGVTLHPRQLSRAQVDVGRTNRFVRLLGAFLARIQVGLARQVLVTVLAADEAAHHLHSVIGQVGRVGTHIGDVAGLVEPLGHAHGLLHSEAQTVACRMLKGGG